MPTKRRRRTAPHPYCSALMEHPPRKRPPRWRSRKHHAGRSILALHAWSDVGVFPVVGMNWQEYEDEGHEVLGERLAGWQEQYPDVHVRRRIVCDRPARWLIDESQQAQLVIVGSHGRGGFPGMRLWLGKHRSSRGGKSAGDRGPRQVTGISHADMSERAPKSQNAAAVRGM